MSDPEGGTGERVQQNAERVPLEIANHAQGVRRAEEVGEEEGAKHGGDGGAGVERDGGGGHAEEHSAAGDSKGGSLE